MTPLPEVLPDDLNEIKALIDSRTDARMNLHVTMSDANTQLGVIDKELQILRDHGSVLLGTKADRSEGKTPKGEQERIATKDTEKTP